MDDNVGGAVVGDRRHIGSGSEVAAHIVAGEYWGVVERHRVLDIGALGVEAGQLSHLAGIARDEAAHAVDQATEHVGGLPGILSHGSEYTEP